MRPFSIKYRLLLWLTLILVAGFLATSVASYVASRDAIEQGISEQTLPLTGDNIYSEIQKDILRPVFISSLMAHDTFVRDWILGGEKNPEQIVRYLNEVKLKYGTVSSFLVSERSHAYYYAGGTLKSVRDGEARDAWYFRLRALATADYETNVDVDMANRDSLTIFINHRVLDFKGNFIGATGVGLTLDKMSSIIDRYQWRFRRNIYFADGDGTIVLGGKTRQSERGSIRTLPGVRAIAGRILNRDVRPTHLAYSTDAASMLVNSRFIPELGWYLVVEQNVSAEVKPMQRVFALNLAVSFGVTLLVLAITLLTVNRFQRRIERIASTDALTGLLNRKALELLLRDRILASKRGGRPLAAILFDIDLFKQVNDSHGHLSGDQVIRGVADLAVGVVRDSDVVTRWGGEEYLVLLGDCNLEQAGQIAEALRRAVEAHDFALPASNVRVTISLGVAEYRHDEAESAFFSRADSALYQAKNGGRNRVQLAPR
ncbi:diguanylate cyclase (GGDEF)-like protein [Janthinobacterium sp. CG_23.3]|uniref:sensor domain-containing diguanylate cyclase n=1 Tax=unclassified Janthinobacterium TaxID=2610881 RepID=UPI000344C11A|nr:MULTISPECIES: sensor domain-containing diguanylate cyclase [unclassified Janthinobacterium]MEC5159921.1 diguanylate cyclase (GGDEF)-like protein [Janthinobacterium sp. CG_S6]